ncbi:hypothetical protein QYE76_065396 [Lolium multiflorum]|uniref:Uncharacterized protein n=1 Tax=Lolium multiflorum TaxID=4521 RepID=A0AAD8SA17_LOLMU|nr:hypothetical protein QYE76_065396 [Lolium multiflorum]
MLAPPLRLVSAEDERRHARTMQQLAAEAKKKAEHLAAKAFSDKQYRLKEPGLPTIPTTATAGLTPS